MVSNIIISKSRFQQFNWIKHKYSELEKKENFCGIQLIKASHVISSYIHLNAYRYRYFTCFTNYKRTILYLNKFINVIYSLHLLHTLSINSFEHSFLLEMIHFKCYLFYLFFFNSFVIYSSIHNKRKFQVRLVIFHTSTTSS